MPTVRVGRRGQVTIPSDVRREFDLSDGDRLLLTIGEDEIVLRPLGPSILELRGSIPVTGVQDFDDIRATAYRDAAERRARRADGPDHE
ncbi:MAG: AbrB/MazE/SpoVT family DNA-binding domain-containing protein [Thermoleophilia bacterium]